MNKEIWHRSIEDLLGEIERPQVTATGPFAINLATSRAPFNPPSKILNFDRLHVYQLAPRHHQGPPKFQLRLGIIETDLEADSILAQVRVHYPSATKEVVDDDDRAAVARAGGSAQPAAPIAPVAAQASIEGSLEDSRVNLDRLLPHLAQAATKS